MGTVSRQFGGSSYIGGTDGLKLVTSDVLTGTESKVIEFEPSGCYLLFCNEWTTSSGAYRGHRVVSIVTPEPDLFGTTAIARGNAYSSTNSGVTLTNNNDSTMTIAGSSATYSVRFWLYRVG